ncbi:TPA: ATP-binding cassette domain-containing protein, partial [Staphylococcus aureus]|nr:ATP-binding cassette domain-containing protein [Staphylococcus aureus]
LITLILSTHTFNTSQLIFMFTVSGVYFSSFSTLFDTINTIGLLKNNMLHVNDILEQNIEEDNNIKVDIEKVDEIEFKNVYFKYPGQSDYILKNISFTIDNNKKIGIVGQTGSGKSTIVGLLLGIYTPIYGDIFINKINLKYIDVKKLRKRIGFVPQDSYVYNKTIKENIIMNRNISITDVYTALEKSDLLKDVNKMPLGINTIISESGSNLSGGQKQRITIARSIANKPNILILDEATSSLDNCTQKNINSNLNEFIDMQIIISHRMKTVIDCHKLIFIIDGEIEAVGEYRYLVNNNKKFQKFVGED